MISIYCSICGKEFQLTPENAEIRRNIIENGKKIRITICNKCTSKCWSDDLNLGDYLPN